MQNVGNRIRALRKAHDLSGDQLGNLCEVSKAMVSQWESNRGLPSTERLIMLHEKLRFSADWLLFGEAYDKSGGVIMQEIIPYGAKSDNHQDIILAFSSMPVKLQKIVRALILEMAKEKPIQS